MEYIIITMFGIFVGMATAGYMFVDEIDRKERKIASQTAMINIREKLIDDQCKKNTNNKSNNAIKRFIHK